MKSIIQKLTAIIKHLRYELLSGILTGGFLLFISIILDIYIPASDPFKRIITLSIFVIATLLLIILIKLKQTIESSLNNVSHILNSQFGFVAYGNEYYRRLRHFTVEKDFLADIFVNKALPGLIKDIKRKNRYYDKIIIICDSGTTITPIFLKLMRLGVIGENDRNKIEIFTNNLAGIDEIQKPVNTTFYALDENNFNVIGGQPLKTYRAITGDITEKFLKTQLWNSVERDKVIIISVVTANWIVADKLSTISLCARGKGHLPFKKEVVQNSDYTFIITPLTKIIRIANMDLLNNIVPYPDKYKSYQIPEEKKETTFLLTSYRNPNSLSPLRLHSRNLKLALKDNLNTNFMFSVENQEFHPKGDKDAVKDCELPHSYIQNSFEDMYGYKLSEAN